MDKTFQIRPISDDLSETPAKLSCIREALNREYLKKTDAPWIVAYSGGKDSTLLLHLVFEMIVKMPPKKRKREVHIVANDTLVESPLVIGHLRRSMEIIRRAIAEMELPMSAVITKPSIDQTFWVNVIGRGYMPPTRNFRWCTDRMKIRPTDKFIRKITMARKQSLLLIGTRKSESTSRRRRMEAYQNKDHLSQHNQIENCQVFSPIAELTDNEVWAILLQASKAPWGEAHKRLITLYRNAGGGECPLVLSKEDAPSCGTTSPRFGCWTCTVVAKDRSLMGLIDSGYEELEDLLDFRNWLVELREDDSNRMPSRRDGTSKYRKDGSRVRGPFTMKIRRRILKRLQKLEKETGKQYISRSELDFINHIWNQDEVLYQAQSSLLELVGARAAV